MFRDLSRAAVLVGVVSAVGQGIPREAGGQNRTGSDPSAVRAFELVGEIGGQIGYDRDEDAPGTDRFLSVLSLPKNPGLTALLPTLPRLRILILGDRREAPYGQWKYAAAGATDRGMAEVAKTKTLQHLRLSGVAVTDAGLASISGLESLERLNLDGTKI